MSDEPALLYLEADDEVTSVVRRLRETKGELVVLVAPGRSRAISSALALRVLARVGEEAGRRVAVVGDALTRSLAAEAGLDAYGSVADARNAVPAPVEARARRASIHVVRGGVSDDTAADTQIVAAPPSRAEADADAQTQAVPVVGRGRRPQQLPVPSDRPSRRAMLATAILGGLAALLIGAGVLGAVVLPAATVALVPITEPLGPISYEIRIDDPVRLSGTVEATAPVTATGTYPIQVAATGGVVFFNFNFVDVAVDAGTLVAAGEQAFGTLVDVVVPAGTLTQQGTILAGEGAVGVAAAAIGEAANVEANAIDTILSQNVAARLRGFPNNAERLVVNPEATSGGLDTTGPEIVQQDVDEAVSALLQALGVAVVDALDPTGEAMFADPPEPSEPVIDGRDGLVGTRDTEVAEISGTLAYDRLLADPDEVTALAEEHLLTDASVLPAGHDLLADATEVTIGEARRDGDALFVAVSVTGASTTTIDREEVIERVRDRSVDDARSALADIGDASIQLWPDWVSSVPGLAWRIEVRIGVQGSGSPVPSPSVSSVP